VLERGSGHPSVAKKFVPAHLAQAVDLDAAEARCFCFPLSLLHLPPNELLTKAISTCQFDIVYPLQQINPSRTGEGWVSPMTRLLTMKICKSLMKKLLLMGGSMYLHSRGLHPRRCLGPFLLNLTVKV